MNVLPSGVYQYRFLVDRERRHSPDQRNDSGNVYNILDLKDYISEDIDSISGFDSPQAPDSSYNSWQLGQEDFAKEPPLAPPRFSLTLLNVPSSHMEIQPPYSRPQNVVLNHLYMHKDKNRSSTECGAEPYVHAQG